MGSPLRFYTVLLDAISKTPQQDDDVSKLEHTEEVIKMVFIPDNQPSEVVEPCEQPFDLPALAISPNGASILSFGSFSTGPVRRDHLDAYVLQVLVKRVAVIGLVADDPFG